MIYSVFGEFHFQIKHSWTLTAASVCWDFMLTASCPQGEQQKAAATFNQIFFQILLISFNANVDKGQAQIYNSYFVLVDHSLYLCHHSSCPWIPWRTLVFTRQQRKVIQGDQGQQPGLNVAVCRISHPLSWQFYTHPPPHKCPQIHNATSCCLSTSSDRVHWPLGEDDGCARLMSWRLKVASPLTSLGSTPTA